MGWGEQADDLIRGFKNIFADDEEASRDPTLRFENEAAKEFRDQTYGERKELPPRWVSLRRTAPRMLLPGGLGMQMVYGGAETGLDHEAEFVRYEEDDLPRAMRGSARSSAIRIVGQRCNTGKNQALNVAVGLAPPGYSAGFDFLGRAFKNAGDDVAEVIGKGKPRVPGQTPR